MEQAAKTLTSSEKSKTVTLAHVVTIRSTKAARDRGRQRRPKWRTELTIEAFFDDPILKTRVVVTLIHWQRFSDAKGKYVRADDEQSTLKLTHCFDWNVALGKYEGYKPGAEFPVDNKAAEKLYSQLKWMEEEYCDDYGYAKRVPGNLPEYALPSKIDVEGW